MDRRTASTGSTVPAAGFAVPQAVDERNGIGPVSASHPDKAG